MPRLFTGLEIPPAIAAELAGHRGGLSGARWVEPANYHITLRFVGDVDDAAARDLIEALAEARPRDPIPVTLDGLAAFGGRKPRSVHARAKATPELAELHAEGERLVARIGLEPEGRAFKPHMTLARLKGTSAADVARWLAERPFPPLTFTAERVVLYSSRAAVGGGPYVIEAAYPFG
ncbi:MAG TPA: RNA 2',3'-cyclic phosphodiesterase [Microvirga sp.]|jgi:2'-5' RNA ligase|nr:RNA 2',3'-cyclic phosphodiesterase [Microvirga sp.]